MRRPVAARGVVRLRPTPLLQPVPDAELPVYARSLRAALGTWQAEEASPLVLQWIMHGVHVPPQGRPVLTHKSYELSGEEASFWERESARLEELGVIARVEGPPPEGGLPAFLVPKAEKGVYRLVVDGRPVNSLTARFPFRMSTLERITPYLAEANVAFSFDIRDAFYALFLPPSARKHWHFNVGGRWYALQGLPMGWSVSPYALTKVFHVFVKALRKRGIAAFAYLDDFLVLARSRAEALVARGVCEDLLKRFGLVRKEGKGEWDPVQKLQHLGLTLDLVRKRFEVPTAKLRKARVLARDTCIQAKQQGRRVSVRLLRQRLGFFQSLALAVPGARLHLRSLWDDLGDARYGSVMLSRQSLRDLRFWELLTREQTGRPFLAPTSSVTVTYDASGAGWGGTLQESMVSGSIREAAGRFSASQRDLHINVKEALACQYVVQSFMPHLRGRSVRLIGDSTTVVSALRKLTSRSRGVMHILRTLAYLLDKNGVSLDSRWIASLENPADRLSRLSFDEDYAVDHKVFASVCRQFGLNPRVDIFGNANSHVTPFFLSEFMQPRDAGCVGVDAFAHARWDLWGDAWINPPWSLLPRVLRHLRQQPPSFRGVLVFPFWTSAPWFPLLKALQGEILVYESSPVFRHRGERLLPPPRWRTGFCALRGSQDNPTPSCGSILATLSQKTSSPQS